jgi:hypothetical protein
MGLSIDQIDPSPLRRVPVLTDAVVIEQASTK